MTSIYVEMTDEEYEASRRARAFADFGIFADRDGDDECLVCKQRLAVNRPVRVGRWIHARFDPELEVIVPDVPRLSFLCDGCAGKYRPDLAAILAAGEAWRRTQMDRGLFLTEDLVATRARLDELGLSDKAVEPHVIRQLNGHEPVTDPELVAALGTQRPA